MRLNINEMPNTNIPYVSVSIGLPNASPDQVESKSLDLLKMQLLKFPVQSTLVAPSTRDILKPVSNLTILLKRIRRHKRLEPKFLVSRYAPSDITEPVIANFNFNEMPIVSLSVTGSLKSAELSIL